MLYFPDEYIETICQELLKEGMTEEEVAAWADDMGMNVTYVEDEEYEH